MSHPVALKQFEGPLGVLLELVERKKLEVTSISIAEITAEYIAHIRALDQHSADELSEFAQLGARLLYVKSLALLPQESALEQAEELHQLNLELDEYRRLQAAARQLEQRLKHQTWQRHTTIERSKTHPAALPELSLPQLAEAFNQAIKRTEPIKEPGIIRRHHVSLEDTLAKLRTKLATSFELQEILDGCNNRLEVIVTFLALLELIREGSARVVQPDQFAPIIVEATNA